jgi:hypothetical protein
MLEERVERVFGGQESVQRKKKVHLQCQKRAWEDMLGQCFGVMLYIDATCNVLNTPKKPG